MAKRDPDDILREEGEDALRAIFDARVSEAEHAREYANGHDAKPPLRYPIAEFAGVPFIDTEQIPMVKGFIPHNAVVVVWGPWKSGKSFWTFDLMMHVACGWSYRGRAVEQGTVVYCALEGGVGMRKRCEAWRRQYPERPAAIPFYLMQEPLDLCADFRGFVESIRAQLKGSVAVVVVDTLNRSLNGDENQKDMARYVAAVDYVRKALQCTVVLVHHCGHDDTRMRGHSALPGAIDAEIKISRDDVGNVVAKVVLMRDGEAQAEEVNRLEQITLGYDRDGDPITSCVVVPVGSAVQHSRLKLTGVTALVLRALETLLADAELPFSGNNPQVAKGGQKAFCPVSRWREHFYSTSGDDQDTKKKQFYRSVRRLQELRIIDISNDHVWLRDKRDNGGTT